MPADWRSGVHPAGGDQCAADGKDAQPDGRLHDPENETWSCAGKRWSPLCRAHVQLARLMCSSAPRLCHAVAHCDISQHQHKAACILVPTTKSTDAYFVSYIP